MSLRAPLAIASLGRLSLRAPLAIAGAAGINMSPCVSKTIY